MGKQDNMKISGKWSSLRSSVSQPQWWPHNPYPQDIFPMTASEFVAAIPDIHIRTAISGFLGRVFWDIASTSIFQAYYAQPEMGQLVVTLNDHDFKKLKSREKNLVCRHGIFEVIIQREVINDIKKKA